MKKFLFLFCLSAVVVSCEKDPDMSELDSDLAVYTDYDTKADFGNFQTYFLPDSILEAGEYKATYWKDENAMKIIDEVEKQMDARGYTRITDPEQKDQANIGLQLSYVAQSVNVVAGGYWGGWWDYGYWGPWWGGWYYPYPITYSYDTNTLVMEMVDLTNKDEDSDIPVVWYVNASGAQYSGQYNIQLLVNSVKQAFSQSEYIKCTK